MHQCCETLNTVKQYYPLVCMSRAFVTQSNTEEIMIPWQSKTLIGCHVLLPTAWKWKCDISAAVTLSQPATERHLSRQTGGG